MPRAIIYGADGAGHTMSIDGITYRVALVNAAAQLVVAVGAPYTPTAVATNRKTVTTPGTQVQLQTQACKAVSVRALSGNTGSIWLGGATVSAADGRELTAGDAIDIAIDNVNRLWIDADIAAEGVSWIAVT